MEELEQLQGVAVADPWAPPKQAGGGQMLEQIPF